MLKDRVGERYITSQGYEIEIIEYFNCDNCTIKFSDEQATVIKKRQYSEIKGGKIRNPYCKTICNVGYIGVGDYKSKEYGKENTLYGVWSKMMVRCYSNKYHLKNPTYFNCSVTEEWHNFQNFAKWYENSYIEGFHLDKDILFKGNKIYSPETCCFVPTEINSIFTKANKTRGDYPIGVEKIGKRYRAKLGKFGTTVHIGVFTTPEEAFQTYKNAKEAYIKEMADKWKEKITKCCYNAMYNYKVKITD